MWLMDQNGEIGGVEGAGGRPARWTMVEVPTCRKIQAWPWCDVGLSRAPSPFGYPSRKEVVYIRETGAHFKLHTSCFSSPGKSYCCCLSFFFCLSCYFKVSFSHLSCVYVRFFARRVFRSDQGPPLWSCRGVFVIFSSAYFWRFRTQISGKIASVSSLSSSLCSFLIIIWFCLKGSSLSFILILFVRFLGKWWCLYYSSSVSFFLIFILLYLYARLRVFDLIKGFCDLRLLVIFCVYFWRFNFR